MIFHIYFISTKNNEFSIIKTGQALDDSLTRKEIHSNA
ncbi:hypothetical protein FHX64_002491 [Microbacter margulisiae]|uniref:Uncharacterized protein n=1 Tax=Microbacter margulisiae TaxID=1350067 RepID=A0A7W5DU68_9PORP|nr:hypothetical protein [Microbacter margulisiae]